MFFMIISRLIGGLGNQMFQYAIGRCLSYKNKCQFKLDIRGFEKYELRKYNLHHFKISAGIATEENFKKIGRTYPPSITTRIIMRIIRELKIFRFGSLVFEQSLLFNPAIMNLVGDVYLDG